VRLSNGLQVVAEFGIDDAPDCTWLIVTGGPGWSEEAHAPATLAFLRRVAAGGNLASVCTGAMILAAAGVLDGRMATTKIEVVPPEMSPLAVLHADYKAIDTRAASLVDAGDIVTGGGVSLCIDATLHLIERALGAKVAAETARIMEYTRARQANAKLFPMLADRPG
jgi:transcriptional regulator GlxA family with amidase domain